MSDSIYFHRPDLILQNVVGYIVVEVLFLTVHPLLCAISNELCGVMFRRT